ncbi:MAG: transposase [Rhodocyclaceae bacterium]|nr:transposase [Rhodocyclaceae bacterium]
MARRVLVSFAPPVRGKFVISNERRATPWKKWLRTGILGCTDPNINGLIAVKFQGAQRDCLPCGQRARSLRKPETTPTRQLRFFRGKEAGATPDYVALMTEAIDSDLGRRLHRGASPRWGRCSPACAAGLDRFTLRGRLKVEGQWKLFCLVHNLEKLARYGMQGTIPRG